MPRGRPFKAGPITTASPIVRELFACAERRELTLTALEQSTRISKQTLSTWRSGRYQPNIMGVEEIADALNMRIVLVPKYKDVKIVPRKLTWGPEHDA